MPYVFLHVYQNTFPNIPIVGQGQQVEIPMFSGCSKSTSTEHQLFEW